MFAARILLITFVAATFGKEFQFQNKEPRDIWVGILGFLGKPVLNGGGFVSKPGQQVSVQAPDDWAGRFWGRSWCDPDTNHCLTGDCGNKLECNGAGGVPPASLAEITLNGSGGLDYYHISLDDGYNVPISIEPLGGNGKGCKKAACNYNINGECPQELTVQYPEGVLGCKSACLAFNNDQYCCRGDYNDSNKCLALEYAKFFKDRCPDAYSYACDDHKSTFTCTAPAYLITFGL